MLSAEKILNNLIPIKIMLAKATKADTLIIIMAGRGRRAMVAIIAPVIPSTTHHNSQAACKSNDCSSQESMAADSSMRAED